jgi:hypothetical protein
MGSFILKHDTLTLLIGEPDGVLLVKYQRQNFCDPGPLLYRYFEINRKHHTWPFSSNVNLPQICHRQNLFLAKAHNFKVDSHMGVGKRYLWLRFLYILLFDNLLSRVGT